MYRRLVFFCFSIYIVYQHLKALTGGGTDLDRVLSRSDGAGSERGTAGVGLGRGL